MSINIRSVEYDDTHGQHQVTQADIDAVVKGPAIRLSDPGSSGSGV